MTLLALMGEGETYVSIVQRGALRSIKPTEREKRSVPTRLDVLNLNL